MSHPTAAKVSVFALRTWTLGFASGDTWRRLCLAFSLLFICRLILYAEYYIEQALSANSSSDTLSSDTCSTSILSFIKAHKDSSTGKYPKVLIFANYKLVVTQSWLQRRLRFVLKTEKIHVFSSIASNVKHIFKKAKNHFLQHANFALSGCPTFLRRCLKLSHKIPLNLGWRIKVFCIIISFRF